MQPPDPTEEEYNSALVEATKKLEVAVQGVSSLPPLQPPATQAQCVSLHSASAAVGYQARVPSRLS